jgi:transcriptional regulator with XRE-family HTH domain
MIIKLLQKLKSSRKRRELFVAGQIKTGIPFQIRALRDKKGWTQGELGAQLGMTQTNISRLESPGYGRLNITTLQRIAAAFDVGLIVRFVPFSELVGWVDKLSPESVAPKSFDEEIETMEQRATASIGDLRIISSAIVQLPAQMFYGGNIVTASHHASLYEWGIVEQVELEQVIDPVIEPEAIPDFDLTVPDQWASGPFLLKGGTTYAM